MRFKGSKAFPIYLLGQGISNLGDSFRFIAVTILIYKLTGSGLNAALGLALSAFPSILASPFAGVLGDRSNERILLVIIDLIRFPVITLFLYTGNAAQVYLLLVLLSLLDIFYGPSRRKFVLGMTGRKGAMRANSLLTGISGAAYLAGPMAAGFLTDSYGTAPAIMISAMCCLISSLITFTASVLYGTEREAVRRPVPVTTMTTSRKSGRRQKVVKGLVPVTTGVRAHTTTDGMREGLRYCRSTPAVGPLMIIGLITGFCTISVNLAFYPYAFDVLKVTAKGWSLMITIYYGTNLAAMLLVKYLERFMPGREGGLFYSGLTAVSFIWVLYAFVSNFAVVLLLQFIEGTVIAMCGILLAARFQTVTDKGFMARVSSVNDVFSNMGKLAGMGCAVLIASRFSFAAVFIFNSAILLLFTFSRMTSTKWS